MPLRAFDRLVDLLTRHHRILLVFAIVITAFSIGPARRLTFDQSIESLYASENERLKDYVEAKQLFGGDEFVFLAYTDPDVFTDAGIERQEKLVERLEKVRGIVPGSIQSLAWTVGLTRLPVFKTRRKQLIEFTRGILLGADNQTTAVAVRLVEQHEASVPRAETLSEIQRIATEQPIETFVVGEPVLVHDMFRYAEEDGEWMGWAASGLLVIVIMVFLRSFRAVLLPFVIVQCAIVWTRAVLAKSNMQLSMVSSILGSLVTIIGVSTVVYMSLYYRRLRETLDREQAFRQTVSMIGMDVFWVCLTTAAGFGVQLSSSLYPVRSFGLTMVIGSLLVLVAMVLVLPSGFLLGPERGELPKPTGDRQVNRSLQGLTHWVLNHPWQVSLGCGLILVVGTLGLFRLRIETDFSKNFRADSPVVKGLNFLESHLGGAGAWEVNFPAPDPLTEEYLTKIRKLAEELRSLKTERGQALTKVLAVTDGIDLVPTIPILSATIAAKEALLHRIVPEFLPSLYNPQRGRMRIMLRAHERQSSESKQQLIAQVEQMARAEFPESKVTGLFVLLTFLIESLLHDQWTDLVLGTIGLVTIMTIAYRNLWMGIISLVPNVIPIILLLGGMGWLSIRVNIGTAMISSDTMGLTIHDSIFYLSAFLRARRSGLDFPNALQHVQTEVRQPLLYSNVALVVGFLVLATSHFVPLIYFGVMVSVAIAGGLAVNLMLLPLLLKWSDRPSQPVPPPPTPTVADQT